MALELTTQLCQCTHFSWFYDRYASRKGASLFIHRSTDVLTLSSQLNVNHRSKINHCHVLTFGPQIFGVRDLADLNNYDLPIYFARNFSFNLYTSRFYNHQSVEVKQHLMEF